MLSLVLALTLAQPISATPGCAPGKNCRAGRFTATTSLNTAALTCWQNATNAVSIYRNSQFFSLAISSTCSSAYSSYPIEINTTSSRISFGTNFSLELAGRTNATAFAAPFKGFDSEVSSGRVFKSDGVRWTEAGGALHPVSEGQTYAYKSDRGTSGAPTWNFPPRYNNLDVTFSTAGTQTVANTQTTYTTTAVPGNQAHHSTGAWHGRGVRWSGRVFVNPAVTTQRAFFGFSDTRPLTAGSDTPTASAAVFRYVTAVSANWFACTASAAALDCVDTGVAVTNADVTLEVDCREVVACMFWINGTARVRKTTNLPGGAAVYGSTVSTETRDANAKLVGLNVISTEVSP